jgi:hypothetical protein
MAYDYQWARSLAVCRLAHSSVSPRLVAKSRHRSHSDHYRHESGVEHVCAPAPVPLVRSHRLHHMSYGFVRASCVSQSRGLVALQNMGPRRSVGVDPRTRRCDGGDAICHVWCSGRDACHLSRVAGAHVLFACRILLGPCRTSCRVSCRRRT